MQIPNNVQQSGRNHIKIPTVYPEVYLVATYLLYARRSEIDTRGHRVIPTPNSALLWRSTAFTMGNDARKFNTSPITDTIKNRKRITPLFYELISNQRQDQAFNNEIII